MSGAPRAACALALACACGFGTNATDTEADTGHVSSTVASSDSTGARIIGTCIADDGGSSTTAGGHNHYTDDDGQCYCKPGYTWRDPFNPNDFDCVAVEPRTSPSNMCGERAMLDSCDSDGHAVCSCAIGDTWCYPSNLDSTRCCSDPAQKAPGEASTTSTSDTGSGTSGPDPGTTTTTSMSCP